MSLPWRSELWPNFACSDKWYNYDPVIIWIQQLDWSDHRLIASSPRMSVQLNNLKNSFLCCKQSQEFMLCAAKQSQEFFLACAANNLKNSCFVLQNTLKNSFFLSFFLACAANNLLIAKTTIVAFSQEWSNNTTHLSIAGLLLESPFNPHILTFKY